MGVYQEDGIIKITIPVEYMEDPAFLQHYTPCADAMILVGTSGDIWRLVDDDGFFLTYIKDPLSTVDSITATTH